MKTEAECLDFLDETSILSVITTQIEEYKAAFHSTPERVLLNTSLRAALAVEIIKVVKLSPDEAIVEPFWIDRVPVIFGLPSNQEVYIKVESRRAGKQLTL